MINKLYVKGKAFFNENYKLLFIKYDKEIKDKKIKK